MQEGSAQDPGLIAGLAFAGVQELNALQEESRQEKAVPESAAEGPLWPVSSEAKG